jgi:adenylyltransferase/sulfurtransferase
MLDKQQLDRYARHIILPDIGLAGQRRWQHARVLVIGAGGLGSPVLGYLAAAGVGSEGCLAISEHDNIALSNLQRQLLYRSDDVGKPKQTVLAAALSAINPELKVVLEHKLTPENALAMVRRYQLVIDGSDNWRSREAVNQACATLRVPLVYGAAEQWSGQVSVFNVSETSPCLRCVFGEPQAARACAEVGVLGSLTGIIGSVMATEALKVLVGKQTLEGILWHFDARDQDVTRVNLSKRSDCPVCAQQTATSHAASTYS